MTASKNEQAAFLAAIRDDPDDDGPRLIFADWLEEQGDPRGEFIRVQCALARLERHDPRRAELTCREQELLGEYGDAWLGMLPAYEGISWDFRRGVAAAVEAEADAFLAH